MAPRLAVIVLVLVVVLVLDGRCGVDFVDRSGKVFVPKGPSEGSLAVYCQGMQETEPVP
jgi:hypothetical protein